MNGERLEEGAGVFRGLSKTEEGETEKTMNDVELKLKGKIPGPDTGIEVRKSLCAICDPNTQCGMDLYV